MMKMLDDATTGEQRENGFRLLFSGKVKQRPDVNTIYRIEIISISLQISATNLLETEVEALRKASPRI